MPLELSLEKRFIRFINVIQKSGTGIVKDVLNLAKSSPWSTCGRNFRDILFKYDEYTSVCEKDVAKRWYKSVIDEEFMTVGMISELINARDERMSCQSVKSCRRHLRLLSKLTSADTMLPVGRKLYRLDVMFYLSVIWTLKVCSFMKATRSHIV